jgi:hypothetical protein
MNKMSKGRSELMSNQGTNTVEEIQKSKTDGRKNHPSSHTGYGMHLKMKFMLG